MHHFYTYLCTCPLNILDHLIVIEAMESEITDKTYCIRSLGFKRVDYNDFLNIEEMIL
jgi:hypothetical protein